MLKLPPDELTSSTEAPPASTSSPPSGLKAYGGSPGDPRSSSRVGRAAAPGRWDQTLVGILHSAEPMPDTSVVRRPELFELCAGLDHSAPIVILLTATALPRNTAATTSYSPP